MNHPQQCPKCSAVVGLVERGLDDNGHHMYCTFCGKAWVSPLVPVRAPSCPECGDPYTLHIGYKGNNNWYECTRCVAHFEAPVPAPVAGAAPRKEGWV